MSHPDECEVCGRYHVGVDCKKPSTSDERCNKCGAIGQHPLEDCVQNIGKNYRKEFDQDFEEKVKEIADEIMGKGPFWSFGTFELKKFAKWFFNYGMKMGKEG